MFILLTCEDLKLNQSQEFLNICRQLL
uniref:Uncharacterized protein n=1 Tax=Arundo donax TaxID=35708 RepID=A0A0A9H245_ARUDO